MDIATSSAVLAQTLQIAPLAIVVSITIGIVQLIKYIDVELRLARFYPALSFVIGMIISEFVFHLDLPTALVTSLSASGTYEVVKRSILGILPTRIDKLNEPVLLTPPPMGETANLHNSSEDSNL